MQHTCLTPVAVARPPLTGFDPIPLPAEPQQAVRLHDLDGLMLREVGLLAGVPVGTVNGRLRRARLRRAVARNMAGGPALLPGLEEEVAMVEVTVDDIIVRAPKGAVATWTGPQDYNLDPRCVVLLKERAAGRILPMWAGSRPARWRCNCGRSRHPAR